LIHGNYFIEISVCSFEKVAACRMFKYSAALIYSIETEVGEFFFFWAVVCECM